MWEKKQTENLMKQLISEDKIIKPEIGRREFFIQKGEESLEVAKKLYEISQDHNESLESYM